MQPPISANMPEPIKPSTQEFLGVMLRVIITVNRNIHADEYKNFSPNFFSLAPKILKAVKDFKQPLSHP